MAEPDVKWRTLTEELAELERTDPEVRAVVEKRRREDERLLLRAPIERKMREQGIGAWRACRCSSPRATVTLPVPIPADLSHEGTPQVKDKPVDECIAPIVAALNAAGIATRSSCCGHGRGPGEIMLEDGRTLSVTAHPRPVTPGSAP